MAHNLTKSQRLSLKINRAFDQLSVNEETIRYRRSCFLQIECNELAFKYADDDLRSEGFYFGSQSEGTTTEGLQSDKDCVVLSLKINVRTHPEDPIPEHSLYNFEMENFTEQGYCLLRDTSFHMGHNDPFLRRIKDFLRPHSSHMYLKNSFQFLDNWHGEIPKKEGPAILFKTKNESINFLDGFACTSWPLIVKTTFVRNQTDRLWPSDHLLQDILQSRCFVVPKGSDIGPNSDIEWRLSFSCGERLLMFDLNIVHIRCYILLKYIKTEFLDCVPNCKGIVSSYICKTVLFHTLSQSLDSNWLEEYLLTYLYRCLKTMYLFIEDGNCPHFIMPKNNLLANKLDENKRFGLLAELQRIITSDGLALCEVKIDEFDALLKSNYLARKYCYATVTQLKLFYDIISHFGWNLLQTVFCSSFKVFLSLCREDPTYNSYLCDSIQVVFEILKETTIKKIYRLCSINTSSNQRLTDSVKILLCMHSTIVGSCQASGDIKTDSCLSYESFQWLLLGMQSTDVASAHLKLASILLLSGDLECTDILLKDICKKFNNAASIAHACQCKRLSLKSRYLEEIETILNKQTFVQIFRENIAYCVVFVPEEIYSCPKELQYEMNRGAFSESQQGYFMGICWVHFASVPQLPFMYFMQYKLYKMLGMKPQSDQALKNLNNFELYDHLRLQHLDTVMNLIGQCLEQEGRYNEALKMYYRSLQIEPEYNAAKILICCNLFAQIEQLKRDGHGF
ncbi:hypothetical protein ACF0H5_023172 [Mactra antiquata]